MAQAANMTQARTYGGGTTARTSASLVDLPAPALTADVAGMFFSPEAPAAGRRCEGCRCCGTCKVGAAPCITTGTRGR